MCTLSGNAPLVVLLRSPDEGAEDRYVRALAERGFRAVCRPVLRFVFAGDGDFEGDDVRACLWQPNRYAGLILTSPRAAQALTDALRERPTLTGSWRSKPVFAVGPKTAAALRGGGLDPQGEESGRAEALGAVIASTLKTPAGTAPARPLLFLCGNRRRAALPRQLRRSNIPYEERVVYETHLRTGPWLQGERPHEGRPAWAVFFSPSGVKAVQRSQESGWDEVGKAAIGPTTAGALRDVGWAPEAVARTPSPHALAAALSAAARH